MNQTLLRFTPCFLAGAALLAHCSSSSTGGMASTSPTLPIGSSSTSYSTSNSSSNGSSMFGEDAGSSCSDVDDGGVPLGGACTSVDDCCVASGGVLVCAAPSGASDKVCLEGSGGTCKHDSDCSTNSCSSGGFCQFSGSGEPCGVTEDCDAAGEECLKGTCAKPDIPVDGGESSDDGGQGSGQGG